MHDLQIGLLPRHVRGDAHFLEPRFAALPAEARQEVRGGGERVRHALDQIAAAVAVIVDGAAIIVGGGELHRAQFAGPVAAVHFGDGEIAAPQDAQGVDKLLAEIFGAAAVIGERRDGAEDVVLAGIGAEVAFEAPERDENRRRNAVLLLDLGENRRMTLHHDLRVLHAMTGDHTVGELQEALLKHLLIAVALDDLGRELHVGNGRIHHGGADALRDRVLAEVLHPAFEAGAVATAVMHLDRTRRRIGRRRT